MPAWLTYAPHAQKKQELLVSVVAAIEQGRGIDSYILMGKCKGCGVEFSQGAEAPKHLGYSYSLPSLTKLVERQYNDDVRGRKGECEKCKAPVDETAFTSAYAARTHVMTGASLVVEMALPITNPPQRPPTYLLRPPGEWTPLPAEPSPEQMIRAYGRVSHPLSAGLQVFKQLNASKGSHPVEWISPEEVVVPLYADVEQGAERENVLGAVEAAGLPGPYYPVVCGFGQMDPNFGQFGLAAQYQQMTATLRVGLVYVFSVERVRLRLRAFSAAYGGDYEEWIDGSGPDAAFMVRFGADPQKTALNMDEVMSAAAAGCGTVDEALHATVFAKLRPLAATFRPGGAALHLIQQANALPMGASAGVAPSARAPPAAGAPAAPPPPPRPRPWARCAQCGEPARIVKRVLDNTGLEGRYGKGARFTAAKETMVDLVLMVGCSEHVRLLRPEDLQAWGIPQNALGTVVHEEQAQDRIKVRSRTGSDKAGAPILGLVGPYAASILGDPGFVEAALAAARVRMDGPVQGLVLGENVLVLAPEAAKKGDLKSMAKELRAISKQSGLHEPMLGADFARVVERKGVVRGSVQIVGQV